ncbi:SDR family NAD(P)-dependent oxidoreductase [Patescibacteria group bacterium]|jgi:UDP-glucuronate 4-epimerase|nr:SDR family NAD(P)-dependent oxidoreductase [Patescibacteria group bacterium]
MSDHPYSKVLVTGGAGFIGNALALSLHEAGKEVVIVDSVNDYYDPALKEARLARLPASIPVIRLDITDRAGLARVWQECGPFDRIAHLAAQAGVRYSLENPYAYADSNYLGTLTLFELARAHEVPVVYASSSSVYGNSPDTPYREDMPAVEPISAYAASKRATELLAHSYCHLFALDLTGLRFFTVYGPWGRPDMAFFKFTRAILSGEPIELYNGGDLQRDFTYIDDIVAGFLAALAKPQGYRIYNLGNENPTHLTDFLATIEAALGQKAEVIKKPMQPGDVYTTYADISRARDELGYVPTTSLTEGIEQFVAWYREFYSR